MNDEGIPGESDVQPTAPEQERVRIFVIFDTEHDRDLYALLRQQTDSPGCGFSVMGGSEASSHSDSERERVRDQIRKADQTIVICGEHTDSSPSIHTEYLIAIDEKKPYFLLWGRRGVMCTKPVGATAAEGMYGWTRQIVHDQIDFNLRQSNTGLEARSLRRVTRDGRMVSAPAATRDEDGTGATTARSSG